MAEPLFRPETATHAAPPRAESLSAGYARVRGCTVVLTEPLAPEDQVVQVMPETSPTKWHLAHTTETPRHVQLVRGHALANRLVTNGEFREFIDDGGYDEPTLWLADGWAKVRELRWSRPLCWSEDAAREFTLGGWRAIDQHAPVCHVSFYEADAFARWAGARLPTEAEWELAGFEPLAGSLGEYNGKFMCNQLVVRGGSCATRAEHVRPTYRSFFYPHDRWQFLGFRLARNS